MKSRIRRRRAEVDMATEYPFDVGKKELSEGEQKTKIDRYETFYAPRHPNTYLRRSRPPPGRTGSNTTKIKTRMTSKKRGTQEIEGKVRTVMAIRPMEDEGSPGRFGVTVLTGTYNWTNLPHGETHRNRLSVRCTKG